MQQASSSDALLPPGELVRLRSVTQDEWLVACYVEDEPARLRTSRRRDLKETDGTGVGEGLTWDNTGFVVVDRGTDDSGRQLVGLDAARFLDSHVYIAEPRKTWFGGAGALVPHKPVRAAAQGGPCATFVVEDASDGTGASKIRLRSCEGGFPGFYLFVSDTVHKVKSFTAATKQQHKVVAGANLAGPQWEAAVFEVTEEGSEAARRQQAEAVKDKKLKSLYAKRLVEALIGLIGIVEVVFVSRKTCPGVPGLKPLALASGIVDLLHPWLALLLLMLAEREVREGEGKMPVWARAAKAAMQSAVLGLNIAVAAFSWGEGYRPLGSGPKSRSDAIEAWERRHNSTFNSTGSVELDYCDEWISDMAFWGPLIIFVLFAVVGGMQVLLWLDEMEKREKAAKEAGNAQAQGASDGEG